MIVGDPFRSRRATLKADHSTDSATGEWLPEPDANQLSRFGFSWVAGSGSAVVNTGVAADAAGAVIDAPLTPADAVRGAPRVRAARDGTCGECAVVAPDTVSLCGSRRSTRAGLGEARWESSLPGVADEPPRSPAWDRGAGVDAAETSTGRGVVRVAG